MHFIKLNSIIVIFTILILVFHLAITSQIKFANAEDLVNYNNNFQIYTQPDDPNKTTAINNIDCVVNFMQTYVYTSSTFDNCNKSNSTPNTQNTQGFSSPPPDNPQTDFSQANNPGVIRIVDANSNNGNAAPIQTFTINPSEDTKSKDNNNNNNDDNNKSKDNKKEYNENTVTKDERKILLKACFDRKYDKGNYLSNKEIISCAKDYNS